MQDPRITDVLVALRRVIRATDLHSRELVRSSGLTAPQLLLLQTVKNKGEATVGALAQEMSLSQATVTSILDRMEARKYVMRKKTAADRRKVYITLTALGKTAIRNAPVPLQESFVEQFSKLPDWEQNMIISALQRIACMMDAQNLDAAPVLDVGTLDR
ncbi:MAG: MarR family transcriptional regulator [Pseudomonadota bacterium]|nr:MarR family transcriptional regulator [Pseudomonadota bacterium]